MAYVKAEDLFAIQKDVLCEPVSKNTSISAFKQLKTSVKYVNGAINGLANQQKDVLTTAARAEKDVEDLRKLLLTFLSREQAIAMFKPITETQRDIFNVEGNNIRTEFPLSKIPYGKILFYINGVRYFEPHFSFENQKITWLYGEEAGGFNITDNSEVIIEYEYIPEEESNNDSNNSSDNEST